MNLINIVFDNLWIILVGLAAALGICAGLALARRKREKEAPHDASLLLTPAEAMNMPAARSGIGLLLFIALVLIPAAIAAVLVVLDDLLMPIIGRGVVLQATMLCSVAALVVAVILRKKRGRDICPQCRQVANYDTRDAGRLMTCRHCGSLWRAGKSL